MSNLFDSNSDNRKTNTIMSLFNLVKLFVSSHSLLKKISLDVEVIEIKNYNSMAFLKIKDATENIAAVIYKNKYKNDLIPNDHIKISGSLTVYRGQLQINIDSYQKNITKEDNKFIVLKNKLDKLGYFDNKPELEKNYLRIGIISSMNAAGLKDFLHTINERCCNKKFFIYPSTVQGNNAVGEICRAIDLANNHNCVEIIVLIRGGGSKDDLECFNSESMAHSIHQSKIPIVTGIGHQIDTSIADLTCAKSYITPTAVAQNITLENTNPIKNIKLLLADLRQKIIALVNNKYDYISTKQDKLEKYKNNLIVSMDSESDQYHNNMQIMKNKIITTTDNRLTYLEQTELNISIYMRNYIHNTKQLIDMHHNNLSNYNTMTAQIIKLYDTKCDNLLKPIIINKLNSEVTSIKKLRKGHTYQLVFIDGTHEIKI